VSGDLKRMATNCVTSRIFQSLAWPRGPRLHRTARAVRAAAGLSRRQALIDNLSWTFSGFHSPASSASAPTQDPGNA